MDTLSKILADQIAFLDEELTPEEFAEYVADREALLESVENLYRGTTSFTHYGIIRKAANKLQMKVVYGPPEQWHRLKERAKKYGPEGIKHMGDIATWSLDDCLSRLMVSEIPRMVSRAMQLEPLLIDQNARVDENPYLREATRCYLFGLFNASVALSRSALEDALSKTIPTLLQGRSREDRLQTLVRTARTSVLKRAPEICDLADKTRKRANVTVHEKPCKKSEALEVLQDTRTILHFLYAPAGWLRHV